MEQLSEEWFAARLGKLTASRVSDALARTKTGWGAGRANYAAELVAERLTGVRADRYVNDAMRFGTENEALARAAYSFYADADVCLIGFFDHPDIPMSGASPDGLVLDDGLVEIKVPNTATHIDTLLRDVIPSQYVQQMQWQMACTGRQWCDFTSFDPRLPENMRLFVKRLERDDKLIRELECEVAIFLDEVAATVERLERRAA